MTSLLLIISFLLHLIALFAIYQLFQLIQKKQKDSQSTEEVMEVLEMYLEEIKAENNRLQKMVEQEEKQNAARQRKVVAKKEAQKTKKQAEPVEDDLSGLDELLNELPVYDVDTSMESRVLLMHAQGMNVEDIAKKLNCGKTEAELIIKFHQK